MTEESRDDEPVFGLSDHDGDEDPEQARSTDLRRVGLVLASALVLLALLLFVLAKVVGGIFGDMLDAVFSDWVGS